MAEVLKRFEMTVTPGAYSSCSTASYAFIDCTIIMARSILKETDFSRACFLNEHSEARSAAHVGSCPHEGNTCKT
jgi:hypothetical protein